jgi:hypothetical protein
VNQDSAELRPPRGSHLRLQSPEPKARCGQFNDAAIAEEYLYGLRIGGEHASRPKELGMLLKVRISYRRR